MKIWQNEMKIDDVCKCAFTCEYVDYVTTYVKCDVKMMWKRCQKWDEKWWLMWWNDDVFRWCHSYFTMFWW